MVTLNYRLGAMGFLAHPSLGTHAGNYGFLDQGRTRRAPRAKPLGAPDGGTRPYCRVLGLFHQYDSNCNYGVRVFRRADADDCPATPVLL